MVERVPHLNAGLVHTTDTGGLLSKFAHFTRNKPCLGTQVKVCLQDITASMTARHTVLAPPPLNILVTLPQTNQLFYCLFLYTHLMNT